MMNFSKRFVRSEFPIVKLKKKSFFFVLHGPDVQQIYFVLFLFFFLFSCKNVFSLRIEASNKLKPWKEW